MMMKTSPPADSPAPQSPSVTGMRGSPYTAPDWLLRLGRWTVWALLGLYFVFAALILSLRYVILPNIDNYRDDIVQAASQALGLKVDVADIDAAWSGLRPQLVLKNVVVHDRDLRTALRLPRVTATLSWDSLLTFDIHLRRLEIDQPDLDIRRDAQGQLFVAGIAIKNEAGDDHLAEWVLAQDTILIRDARVRWNDERRKSPELAVSHIELTLQRTRLRHDFILTSAPPEILRPDVDPVANDASESVSLAAAPAPAPIPAVIAPLNLRGHFETPFFTRRPADATQWSGEIYTEFSDVDLAAWHAWVDYPIELTRGRGALRAWLTFAPEQTLNQRVTRLPELTADLKLEQVSTRLRKDLPVLQLDQVSGRIILRQLPNGEELQLQQFSLKESGAALPGSAQAQLNLPATNLSAQHTLAQGKTPEQGTLTVDTLDLDTLASLTERLPLSPDLHTLLLDYQPRGLLRTVNFKWQGALTALQTYDLSAQFERLSISSHPETERPGFDNLSGQVKATEGGGSLSLSAPETNAAQNIKLAFPGYFAEPEMSFDHLSAQLSWRIKGAQLDVKVDQIALENADLSGTASGQYHLDRSSKSSGDLDLTARLARAEANRIYRYLPVGVHIDTRNYLQAALLNGRAEDVDFRVLGPLDEFPFNENRMRLKSAASTTNASALKSAVNTAVNTAVNVTTNKLSNIAPKDRQFHIAGKIRQVNFNYAPEVTPNSATSPWPIIENVDGDLLIDKQRITIKAERASLYGVALEQVKADLADMEAEQPLLLVTGNASGALSEFVRFVNTSPVAAMISHFTADTRASGAAKLSLKLDLPLAKINDAKVAGTLLFQNNDVTLLNELPPLQRVNGRLDFSESGVGVRGVTGQFVGGPMKLDGATRNGVIELRGDGTVNLTNIMNPALNLRSSLGNDPEVARLAERLSGSARYTVALNIPVQSAQSAATTGAPLLLVESNLIGLGINLPDPLKKPVAENWPLRVEMAGRPGTPLDELDEIRLRVGNSFNALFERRRLSTTGNNSMRITRAAYGINQPATLKDAASYANINLKTLDADAWLGVLDQASTTTGNASDSANGNNLLPDAFAIRATDLRLSGKNFANVVASGSRKRASNGEPMWQSNVESDQVSGAINWQQGARQNLLTARLTRLKIPQSDTTEASVNNLLDTATKEMPALDIVADNFELSGKKLGRLELQATNSVPNASNFNRREWQLQKLTISNDDALFDARGVWGPELALNAANSPPTLRTRLSFSVKASNVGKLMDRFGSKDTVRNGTALLEGEVGWRGSPLAIDYPTLDGRMRLEADKGQFLKAEPGIAKLLGVLSLQSLPRRLTLDFRDVFSEGFAFDEIRANVTVENGTAATKDFKMRGVAATVLMEGSTDLARETQNLHVLVLPEINAGAASLGYAALANPAIGLATFLAQYVLRDPLSRAFSYEYNVVGSWANPTIAKTETKAPPSPATPSSTSSPTPTP